jgi:outer membrane autotransporter protein
MVGDTLLGLRTNLGEMALGDDLALSPKLDLGWQHLLAPFTPGQTVNIVNAETSFLVLGTPLAKDAANLQAGFDLKLGNTATLSLSYDGSFSPTVESHGFRGGLRWNF